MDETEEDEDEALGSLLISVPEIDILAAGKNKKVEAIFNKWQDSETVAGTILERSASSNNSRSYGSASVNELFLCAFV